MIKNLFLLSLALFIAKTTYCQDGGTDYAFKSDVRVYRWDESKQTVYEDIYTDPVTKTDYEIFYRALRGTIFTIRQKTSIKIGDNPVSGYRIKFWPFNRKGKQIQISVATLKSLTKLPSKIVEIGKDQNAQSYFVPEDDIKTSATTDFIRPKSWAKVDGVVIPVKIRFKNHAGGTTSLEQSIAVGPAINWSRDFGDHFTENTLSFLAGANLSSIAVDEKTVPTVVTSKTTLLGLSPFVGINYNYHGVSFGLMTGIDILSGKAEDNFVYRKSPWLGFTIGTSLISIAKAKQ